jgi:hypothetical protein
MAFGGSSNVLGTTPSAQKSGRYPVRRRREIVPKVSTNPANAIALVSDHSGATSVLINLSVRIRGLEPMLARFLALEKSLINRTQPPVFSGYKTA